MSPLERLGLEVAAYQILGSRSQAALLCALIDAKGAVLSWEQLAAARPWKMRSDETTSQVIKTRVCLLRQSMDDVGLGGLVKTAGRKEGVAYHLPDPGRTEVIVRLVEEAV
jgi:DNA-binding response OmpR family regulator